MKLAAALFALLAFGSSAEAQTVWTTTNAGGAVTGYYSNAAPNPTPPNCCTVMDVSNPRIAAFLNPPPTPQQTYDAAITAGLTVSSTATPALSATYAVDDTTELHINSEMSAFAANGAFTNGQTTKFWPNLAQTGGGMFTIAQFKTLATAIGAYKDALLAAKILGANGATPVWPAAAATIP